MRIDSFQNTPDYSGEYNMRSDSFQSTPDVYSGEFEIFLFLNYNTE